MRTAVVTLTCLSTLAALFGVAGHARAGDASSYYEPPPTPVPPPVAAMPPVPLRSVVPGTAPSRPNIAPTAAMSRLGAKRVEPVPHGRVCFSPAETREKIAAHRLTEPFRALRTGRLQGQALRAKLCRWKPDEFVYEVAVLRSDGRVVHVYMNALNGQNVGALGDPDRH